MKIYSFNVNGLRACRKKGFDDFIKSYSPDILGIQETKMQEDQVDFHYENYYEYYFSAKKKGYSGVAVYTKKAPLKVIRGIGNKIFDDEGRTLTLEYDNFYFVCAYVPNSKDKLLRLEERMHYEKVILEYLNQLDKPLIYTGDLNVAPEEIDLANPESNHKNPGFSDEERAKFRILTKANYFDAFRYLYPDKVKYSWWSYRTRARDRNVGWRIDHFILSNSLKNNLVNSDILTEVMGSDHCPISLEISL